MVNFTTDTASNMMNTVISRVSGDQNSNARTKLPLVSYDDDDDDDDDDEGFVGLCEDALEELEDERISCHRTPCLAHVCNLVCKQIETHPFIKKALDLNATIYAQFRGNNIKKKLREYCKNLGHKMDSLVQNIAIPLCNTLDEC